MDFDQYLLWAVISCGFFCSNMKNIGLSDIGTDIKPNNANNMQNNKTDLDQIIIQSQYIPCSNAKLL